MSLIEKRYSKSDITKWQTKREVVLEERENQHQKAITSNIEPIYDFDKDVLDLADLSVSKNNIKTSTGFNYELKSDLEGKDFSYYFNKKNGRGFNRIPSRKWSKGKIFALRH